MNKKQVSLFKTVFSTKMLVCVFTGFISGLPFYLLTQLLPAWLTSEGLDIKAISAFSLTQIPYITKFVWAPFMDNISLFKMGRRRGWMFLSQIVLLFFIAILGCFSPTINIWVIATLCFIIALFSATQDIALDAFRKEILSDNELGLGNSIHTYFYRLASFLPGSLSLILSQFLPWSSVFMITALFMLPPIFITLWIKEPLKQLIPKSHNLKDIIINPFLELVTRKGTKSAMVIMTFIFLYKLGDSMATSLATTFYMKMGFSRIDIGLIVKNAQLWPSIFGGIVGGILMIKIGINRALWCFGFVQVFSILGFAWLSIEGPFDKIGSNENMMLALVIGLESLGVGLGTAAFVAFIAKTTNPLYTATQFALFTSIASIPRTLINSTTGILVENLGWTSFYGLCTILAIPGMLLLFVVAPWNKKT